MHVGITVWIKSKSDNYDSTMVSPSGVSKYLNKAVEVHMKEGLDICENKENKRFKSTFSCVTLAINR